MRIGLDIDNVILDTDKYLLKAFIKEDKNKRGKGIIDKNADYIMSGMFDWTKEEIEEFLINNMESIARRLKPKKYARKYINKLYKNHEIYLISNRSLPYYKDAYNTTYNNLVKNKIKFHKLILTDTNDKSKECIKYNIDIMFDDRASNCFKLREKDIKCYLVRTRYEKRSFNDLEILDDFKDIYNVIERGIYERV